MQGSSQRSRYVALVIFVALVALVAPVAPVAFVRDILLIMNVIVINFN